MSDHEPVATWSDLIPAALRLAARIPAAEPIALTNTAWPATDHAACGRDVVAALHQAHPRRNVTLRCGATGRAMCGVVVNA